MKPREFVGLFGGAVAWPVAARAQPPERMRRIGVLVGLAENDPEMKQRLAGFREGLEKLRWFEGGNVRIDYRFAPAGTQAHLLARKLVALHPDVILAQCRLSSVSSIIRMRVMRPPWTLGRAPGA